MKSPVYIYKKLHYLYNVIETFTAGIMLEGWEVKALNEYSVNIETAYCGFKGKNFCLLNSKITPLSNHILNDTVSNLESRDRILLLNKKELNRIQDMLQTKGLTCIPGKLYKNDVNLWKIDISVCSGKKNWDRREDIKKRDIDRQNRSEF